MEECDADQDGKLTKDEVFDCIDEHVPKKHRQFAKDAVEENWGKIAGKDGEADIGELEAVEKHCDENPEECKPPKKEKK